MKKITAILKEISGGKILDVATGRGTAIKTMQHSLKDYDEIIGIDNSAKAVQVASQEFADEENVEIKQMDALNLDFADNTFDMVTIFNSLHHFYKLQETLTEMKRVLKPGGYFVISEMCCDEDQSDEQLTHVLLHHWWGEIDTRLGITHNKTYSSFEMENIIRSLGLKDHLNHKYSYPIEDPLDEKLISTYLSIIDPYVDRLKEHTDYDKLKSEGEELKKRLQSVGYAPARSIFYIGVKQGD
jgi:ubiquinone/menaquinone biosynthesis C-methylase UbiE